LIIRVNGKKGRYQTRPLGAGFLHHNLLILRPLHVTFPGSNSCYIRTRSTDHWRALVVERSTFYQRID
jgi:hypothetical protein